MTPINEKRTPINGKSVSTKDPRKHCISGLCTALAKPTMTEEGVHDNLLPPGEIATPQINRVTIKPPPFWKAEPQLWFVQLEAQFQISGITADITKYNYVVSAIETSILTQVTDLITQPPLINKYEALKNRLS